MLLRYAAMFVLAGIITVLVALLAKHGNSRLAGLFVFFPVLGVTSFSAIWLTGGARAVERAIPGAAISVVVLGIFLAGLWGALRVLPYPAALAAALALWAGVAALASTS